MNHLSPDHRQKVHRLRKRWICWLETGRRERPCGVGKSKKGKRSHHGPLRQEKEHKLPADERVILRDRSSSSVHVRRLSHRGREPYVIKTAATAFLGRPHVGIALGLGFVFSSGQFGDQP